MTMTTDLDRTTVILSIRPVYVDRILAGEKNIEWRRKPLPEQVKTVLIWRTATKLFEGCIVGKFDIAYSTTAPVRQQVRDLDSLGLKAGISTEDLAKYAGGISKPITGIVMQRVEEFEFAGQERLGLTSGPQSFCYAPADWRERLEVAW